MPRQRAKQPRRRSGSSKAPAASKSQSRSPTPCPFIIGLTGSLGSGKSFVSSLLAACGAKIIDADAIARQVVEPGSEGLQEVVQEFGAKVLRRDGGLDRRLLAQLVFADPFKRQQLEQIIHPRVRQRTLDLLAEYQAFPLIVLDVPLLFETEADVLCNLTLVVAVSDEVRFERLERDRGMSREEVAARLRAQMPQDEKIRRAHVTINNSQNRSHTCYQVKQLLASVFPLGLPEPLSWPPCHLYQV